VPNQIVVSEQRVFTDEFHAKTPVASTLCTAAVALGAWMLGAWVGNLHTSSEAIHGIGTVVAIAGAVTSFSCAWLAVRAWIVQHRR
jgi:hypothetical protein